MDLLASYGSDDDVATPPRGPGSVPATAAVLQVGPAEIASGLEQPFKRAKPTTTGTLNQPPVQPNSHARCLSDPNLLLNSPNYVAHKLLPVVPDRGVGSSNGIVQQQSTVSALTPEPARVRAFPHVEGNYPTVVYIPVPDVLPQQLLALAAMLIHQCPAATAQAAAAGTGSSNSGCMQLWPTFPFVSSGSSSEISSGTRQHRQQGERQQDQQQPPQQQQGNPQGSQTVPQSQQLQQLPVGLDQGQQCMQQTHPLQCVAQPNHHYHWHVNGVAQQCRLPGGQQVQQSDQHQQQPVQQPHQQPLKPQHLPLHMTISRTVPIRHIQIASLRAALSKHLKPFRAFAVELHGLCCLVNDNDSRTFVGLRVSKGQQKVVHLVEAVNRAFILHGLPTFHEDPLPHVSLAWTPGNQVSRLQPWLDGFQHKALSMQVTQVVCQAGCLKHTVWEGW